MVKKTFKFVSIALTLAVSAGMFTGCSKTVDKTDNNVSVVKVWTNEGHTKELITQMVDEYNKTTGAAKGIKIEYTVHGGDYKKTIDMAIAGDQAPDMFNVQGSRVPYVQKGSLMALEDMPGGAEFVKKYEKVLTPMREVIGGKTYAVPFSVTTVGLIYNKDMFKKAGIVDEKGEALPPKTWEEVRIYAKKLTKPQEKQYGIALPLKWGGFVDWELFMPMRSSLGRGAYAHKTGTYDYSVIKPALEHLLKIKEDKSFFPGAEGLDNDPARAQFAEGRIGMKLAASWDVGVLNEQYVAKHDWGVAPLPVLDVNNKYYQSANAASFVEISSTAQKNNLEKVFEVYKWLNSEEFLIKMYEEGKHIPFDSEIIKKAKNVTNKKGWKEFSAMMDISKISVRPEPPVKIQGETYNDVVMKVWLGAVSIDDAIQDLDKRYNESFQSLLADGTVDKKYYVFPDLELEKEKR